MSLNRVVITGVGLTSPIGNSLEEVSKSLREGKGGVKIIPEFAQIQNLKTRLAAPVDVDLSVLPKKKTRTMGRVAQLSTWATQKALDDSGLPLELLGSGRVGLAYGSTSGSVPAIEEFIGKVWAQRTLSGIQSATYLKLMSHTAPANLAAYFGIRGMVLTTCSACVSSSQGIGYGYQMIKHGLQDAMIVGGAEEMHIINAAVFDIMFATSCKYNEEPDRAPRPFDADRDGLVTGEGAGTLILESYERAKARGAKIYAELAGFATNCDGAQMTAPSEDGVSKVMKLALEDAQLNPDQIDYINAHATSTPLGDITESRATLQVMGDKVPVSSTKGFTGHTLGGCGVIEAGFCLTMLRDGYLAPNKNLAKVDPECAPLNYVIGGAREARPKIIMNNNFAFAGLNTSMILKKLSDAA